MSSSETPGERPPVEENNQAPTNDNESERLKDFLMKPKPKEVSQSEDNDETKALSRRERKNAYQRKWNARKRLEFEELKNNQIKGVKIILLNVNNTINSKTIKNEDDYIKFIDDLLDTLRANGILNDFDISSL